MEETSEKQQAANRQNALLGGVKTEEGKEKSKYNALKHGLLTKEVLIEGENEGSLQELAENLNSTLEPNGELELLLVDRIISNMWRLRRLIAVERATIEYHRKSFWTDAWGKEAAEFDEKRGMLVNNDTEKLIRYEVSIERSLFKAIHELQRLQAMRNGIHMPPPVAVDVDISKEN
jgi:hypothetical protein